MPLQFVIERIAMLAVGIEGQGPALKWGASIAALVFVAAFGIGVQRDRPRAAIYFVGIIAAPAVLIAGLESSFLAPRYFGFSIVVFLIAGGGILGALATSGRWGAGVACVLLALFLAVNARTAAPLLYQGRGEYARALQLMDRESARGPLEIGLRLQFRHGMVLRYFAQAGRPGTFVCSFVTPEDWPRKGSGVVGGGVAKGGRNVWRRDPRASRECLSPSRRLRGRAGSRARLVFVPSGARSGRARQRANGLTPARRWHSPRPPGGCRRCDSRRRRKRGRRQLLPALLGCPNVSQGSAS